MAGACALASDFARLQAAGADVEPLAGAATDDGPDRLDVGVEAAAGAPVRVRHAHAEPGTLATHITDGSHGDRVARAAGRTQNAAGARGGCRSTVLRCRGEVEGGGSGRAAEGTGRGQDRGRAAEGVRAPDRRRPAAALPAAIRRTIRPEPARRVARGRVRHRHGADRQGRCAPDAPAQGHVARSLARRRQGQAEAHVLQPGLAGEGAGRGPPRAVRRQGRARSTTSASSPTPTTSCSTTATRRRSTRFC